MTNKQKATYSEMFHETLTMLEDLHNRVQDSTNPDDATESDFARLAYLNRKVWQVVNP